MPFKKENYPPDWNDRIRPDILKRDGYKCKECKVGQRKKGYRNESGEFIECDEFMLNWAKRNGKKIITIYLSVAHLDHNTENNDYENLAALCQRCHNRHDRANRILNRVSKRAIVIIIMLLSFIGSPAQTVYPYTWEKIAHFHPEEFDCTCGGPAEHVMNMEFVRKLDIARTIADTEFIITSGFRTKEWNSEISGAIMSSHVSGYGADIFCIDPERRYRILAALYAVGFTRIGIYPTHIHVDSDPNLKPYVIWYH